MIGAAIVPECGLLSAFFYALAELLMHEGLPHFPFCV